MTRRKKKSWKGKKKSSRKKKRKARRKTSSKRLAKKPAKKSFLKYLKEEIPSHMKSAALKAKNRLHSSLKAKLDS